MNLNQLKYFMAIVKTGSFSNAADDMYISQSSMSKQIKALETELGCRSLQTRTFQGLSD